MIGMIILVIYFMNKVRLNPIVLVGQIDYSVRSNFMQPAIWHFLGMGGNDVGHRTDNPATPNCVQKVIMMEGKEN